MVPVLTLAARIAPSSDLRCGGRAIVGNQAAFGLALKAAEARQGRIKGSQGSSDARAAAVIPRRFKSRCYHVVTYQTSLKLASEFQNPQHNQQSGDATALPLHRKHC